MDFANLLQANKLEASLLILFIPSANREGAPIDQEHWVSAALEFLGTHLGGATAYPKARGVWRDDERGGVLIFDEPVLIQCYTNDAKIQEIGSQLRDFLVRMGSETRQGAIGVVFDQKFFEIRIP